MADFTLIPGKSNASATASWEGGVVPTAAADTRIFIHEGDQEITNFPAINVNRFVVGPKARVSGDLPLSVTNGTTPSTEIVGAGGLLRLSGSQTRAVVTGRMEVRATGGTWARLFTREATVRGTAAIIEILESIGSYVMLDALATAVNVLKVNGGSFYTARSMKAARFTGAAMAIFDGAATVADGGSGLLEIEDPRARVEILGQSAGITIDNLVGLAGAVITKQAKGPITLTNSTLAEKFNFGRYYPMGASGQVTLTNPSTLLGSPEMAP